MSKKILLLTDSLLSGGAERQISYLAAALKKTGCEVRLVTFYERENFYGTYLSKQGIPVETHPEGQSKIKRPFTIANLVKVFKPDAVIAYKEGCSMAACLAKLITPFHLIVSERNTTQVLNRSERLRFGLFRLADAIVPNSRSQARFIKEHFPALARKTSVITNMVDLECFSPDPKNNDASASKRPVRVLTTARLMRQKNILNYLEAVKMVVSQNPNVVYEWYGSRGGDEAYVEEVLAKVKQLGLEDRVAFNDPVKNVAELYRSADIFCLPSAYEGFPNVVCEAMACGLPVACSNVCDNPWIVEEGVNGVLFPPDNPAEMAGQLLKLINMAAPDRHEMGKVNRRKMEETCSSKAFVDSYLALIPQRDKIKQNEGSFQS